MWFRQLGKDDYIKISDEDGSDLFRVWHNRTLNGMPLVIVEDIQKMEVSTHWLSPTDMSRNVEILNRGAASISLGAKIVISQRKSRSKPKIVVHAPRRTGHHCWRAGRNTLSRC